MRQALSLRRGQGGRVYDSMRQLDRRSSASLHSPPPDCANMTANSRAQASARPNHNPDPDPDLHADPSPNPNFNLNLDLTQPQNLIPDRALTLSWPLRLWQHADTRPPAARAVAVPRVSFLIVNPAAKPFAAPAGATSLLHCHPARHLCILMANMMQRRACLLQALSSWFKGEVDALHPDAIQNRALGLQSMRTWHQYDTKSGSMILCRRAW